MRIPRRSIKSISPSSEEHHTINSFINDTVNAFQSIEFGTGLSGGADNVRCDFATVTFGVAGTELTASHNLRKIPIGVWMISKDSPGVIFNSTAPTSASVFLKSDTDSLSGVIVII
jgi:hypothetical protein